MEGSDKTQRVFFALLRSGLWNRDIGEELDFTLTESEWKDVWQQATHQAVRGLVYAGICMLPEVSMPSDLLMVQWTAEIDLIERRNRYINKKLVFFFHQIKALGPVPVLMKGQGVAQFYVEPLQRESGDVDLFFHSLDEERRVVDFLRNKGLVIRTEPDGSHEYAFQGVEMEHHTRIFDLYAPGIQSYLSNLVDRYGFVELPLDTESEVNIVVPSPLLNLILLNVHILKHSMGHGIGLRQFCDLARAYHQLKNKYDGEELKACFQKCDILRWTQLLHSFLVNELELPMEDLPYTETILKDTGVLLNKVLKEGNFGKYSSARKVLTPSVWSRKMNTAMSFVRNLRFSMTYAPHEAMALMSRLFIGNLKS